MRENKRVQWIDVVRGIVIIMVLLNHSSTSAIRNKDVGVNILYLFTVTAAMPIMMFISGCSVILSKERYKQMAFKDFLKKKFKSLLVPYLCYATIIYLIFEFMSFIPGIGDVMRRVDYGGMHPIRFLVGLLIGNNEFSIHLWFLYVLFFYEIITFLVFKYCKTNLPLYIIAVIAYILGHVLYVSFSMSFENGLLYFTFFSLGIYFGDGIIRRALGIGASIGWILLFLVYLLFVRRNTVAFEVLAFLIPLCACFAATFWGQTFRGKISDILQWFGNRSMTLYLFQQPFFGSALGTVLYGVLGFQAWPSVFICIVMSIAMPLLIRQIFVRYKWFRTMFGVK